MPLKLPLLFLPLCYLITSCNPEAPETENKFPTAKNQFYKPLHPDTLRKKYSLYREEMESDYPVSQISESGKVYPADEAPADTTFFVFREDLIRVLQQRNAFGLMPAVANDIKGPEGIWNGIAEFVKHWELDSAEGSQHSPIWLRLIDILRQGGIFTENGNKFEAPYLTAGFPGSLDPKKYGVITGSGVRIREKPTLDSPVVAKLSHDIVEYLGATDFTTTLSGETHPWIKIRHKDREGYVFGKFFAQALQNKAVFSKTAADTWELSLFYAQNNN